MKDMIPGVNISTDIIVGFPGEEEADFLETMSLVKECQFDNAFTFIFSAREDTPASRLTDNTPLDEKEERLQRLNEVVNEIFLEKHKQMIGKDVLVMVEGISSKKNQYYGYSETNQLINFTSDNKLKPGDIISVTITDAKTWSLDGES